MTDRTKLDSAAEAAYLASPVHDRTGDITPWADLPDGIREAWRGVSGAVLEVLKERLQEEDAEANEMPDLWIQGFRFAKSIILEEQAMLAEILEE